MHFLDDELSEMFEYVFKRIRLGAAIRRHVLQYSGLARVKFYDFRHVGVDRLVVGDSCARRVSECDATGAVDVHNARDTEQRVAIEIQRIDIVVIDASV